MVPSPEQLAELHQLLLAGDATAPAMLAEAVLDELTRRVESHSRRTRDPQLVADAVVDAVMDFVKAPERFDPSQMGILSFLEMAARRNLSNALVSLRRQNMRILQAGAVALEESARNEKERRPLDALSRRERTRRMLDAIDAEQSKSFSPEEVAVLRLIADGERATDRYAEVLGLSDKPVVEQRRIVKQVKDRLMKRLKRSIAGIDDDD